MSDERLLSEEQLFAIRANWENGYNTDDDLVNLLTHIDALTARCERLEEERDAYHAAMATTVADAERYAHGWLMTNATFDQLTAVLWRWAE